MRALGQAGRGRGVGLQVLVQADQAGGQQTDEYDERQRFQS